MKRLIGMVAAMALLASSAANAQNTQVEIHQYFTLTNAAALAGPGTGGATSTPADWATNPNVTVPAGSTVYLAVWIRALRGDSPNGTTINSYNYEITGTGNTSRFHAAGDRTRDLGGVYLPTPGVAANPAVDYVDLPGADSQMFGISGAVSTGGGSLTDTAAGDSAAPGAYLIRVIAIDTTGAQPGDTLNLYMTTPQTSASKYQVGGNLASLTTVAYGANASGGMDQKRASNLTADVIGTLNDRVSSLPDASIHILVPEPGTIALLGLGILALRRRRSC